EGDDQARPGEGLPVLRDDDRQGRDALPELHEPVDGRYLKGASEPRLGRGERVRPLGRVSAEGRIDLGAELRLGGLVGARGEDIADAREELVELERLGDVI